MTAADAYSRTFIAVGSCKCCPLQLVLLTAADAGGPTAAAVDSCGCKSPLQTAADAVPYSCLCRQQQKLGPPYNCRYEQLRMQGSHTAALLSTTADAEYSTAAAVDSSRCLGPLHCCCERLRMQESQLYAGAALQLLLVTAADAGAAFSCRFTDQIYKLPTAQLPRG